MATLSLSNTESNPAFLNSFTATGVVISLVVVIALLMVLIIGSMFSKDSKSDDKKNDNKTENEVTENNEETIMFGEVLQYLYFEDNKYILFSPYF